MAYSGEDMAMVALAAGVEGLFLGWSLVLATRFQKYCIECRCSN